MIGIISAISEESAEILANLKEVSIETIAGIAINKGKINGKDVVVCDCGIGKSNAAICATTLITIFKVSKIIFAGVAGAVNKNLEIGDIVISKDLMYHDFDVTALGYEVGRIPRMNSSVFVADENLVKQAMEVSSRVATDRKVILGRVLSGDRFVSDDSNARQIFYKLEGDCVEMEGAAIAHACYLFGLPFVVIRLMSDKADSDATVDFPEFLRKSSVIIKDIVSEMVGEA